MARTTNNKIMELSFTVMEKIFVTKDFKSKEEVLECAEKFLEQAVKIKAPMEVVLAHKEAIEKIKTLTMADINEIKKIIKDNDED